MVDKHQPAVLISQHQVNLAGKLDAVNHLLPLVLNSHHLMVCTNEAPMTVVPRQVCEHP